MLFTVLLLGSTLLSGVMIGAALGIAGIFFLYFYAGGTNALMAGAISSWEILYNFTLTALPLYIFLGELFVSTGIAQRSYDAIAPVLERFPGKLLLSNVAIDAAFGAVVGSSLVTAAAVGSIAYPELNKRGYDRTALVGNLAGAGTLGSFIPPSLPLIIYGTWVQVSIGSCFMAALFPALITTGLFLAFVMVYCSIRPGITPIGGEILPLKRAFVAAIHVWPLVLLIFFIMGVILLGVATPTEAAGLAAVMAIIISIILRTFSFKGIYNALIGTVRTCGMIFFIIMGALLFATSISLMGVPRQIVLAIQATGVSPLTLTLLIYALYIVLGCFFDFIGMLVMTLPFTYPIMMSIGADPFWFGVVLVVVAEMGLLTPPVGLNLYVLQGVTKGEVSLMGVAKGAVPYFLLLGVTLCLITVFPQLCTWLPYQMR